MTDNTRSWTTGYLGPKGPHIFRLTLTPVGGTPAESLDAMQALLWGFPEPPVVDDLPPAPGISDE